MRVVTLALAGRSLRRAVGRDTSVRVLALMSCGALALALVGCIAPPPPPTGPVSVHIIHRYQNETADSFGIPAGSGIMHVSIILENFYKSRCPAPTAQIELKDPQGAVHAQLATQNLPFSDCVYTYDKNETLAPGYWRVEYVGGSDNLGSVVDVRPVNAIAT